MDKLYEQLNQSLPSILQGATITKDYFHDLFNRYVTYLIITDSLQVAFLFCGLIASISLIYIFRKEAEDFLDNSDFADFFIVMFIVGTIGIFLALMVEADHIIKDLTIPEIRIYEQFTKE